MIYNNIEFFNISDYTLEHDIPGIILQRYPLCIQEKMGYLTSTKGADKAKTIGGAEVRFVSDADAFEISLFAIDSKTTMTVFQGDFQNSSYTLEANQINIFKIKKHERFLELNVDNSNSKRRYSTDLWRIVFDYGAKVSFISLNTYNTPYNSPTKADLPMKTYLAYGSSITQGAGATSIHDCYISLYANLTNSDIINKGLSGSCLLEKEIVDYLQTIPCDEYLFEIGCNARGVMDDYEFEKRFDYLISTTLKKKKEITIINMLEFFKINYAGFPNIPYQEKNVSFTNIIKKIVTKYQDGKITLINSNNLLPNLSCISYDMLHPSNYGHLNMAINLKLLK